MNEIESEISKALSKFPGLKVVELNPNQTTLEGEIQLEDGEFGGVYDSYEVRIVITQCFPKCFPKVFELNEKIPRKTSRHVNPDNSLCLGVLQQELMITRHGIKLIDFINFILKPHLSRETYREIKGFYPHGEYSHGWEGILEYFYDKYQTKNPEVVVRILHAIIYNQLPDRMSEECVCGKKRKYRKCHRIAVDETLKLDSEYLKQLYLGLKSYLNDRNNNL